MNSMIIFTTIQPVHLTLCMIYHPLVVEGLLYCWVYGLGWYKEFQEFITEYNMQKYLLVYSQ